jgi:hypothetical protein
MDGTRRRHRHRRSDRGRRRGLGPAADTSRKDSGVSTISQRSHVLYRFYDDGDELLYVGITANPSRRFEIEHFADRETVLTAERTAIETEAPRHNIRMNERGNAAYSLAWICEVCNIEIADGDGWLTCSDFEVADVERREREIYESREHSWSPIPLSDFPDHAQWHKYHRLCDPDPNEDSYWINVERIRTLPELLAWTGHLMQKRWIRVTNWSYLIEGIAHQHGSVE